MTTATATNLIWRAGSTTENYNWVKKISDALTAIGLLKTADTGQLPLTGTTLAIPATPDETFKQAGYEIRALTKAGFPTLYIRIDYGVRRYTPFSAAATNVVPVLRISVGTETSGAGVLGGVLLQNCVYSALGFYYNALLPGVAPRPFYFSSDGESYLTMLIDPALLGATGPGNAESARPPFAMMIERSIDPATGNYDADGFIVIGQNVEPTSDASYLYYRYIANLVGGYITYSNIIPAQVDATFSTSASGAGTTLFPLTVLLPKPKAPSKSLLFFYRADIPNGLQFSTTVYGQVRTYIACSGRLLLAASGNAECYPAFRYD